MSYAASGSFVIKSELGKAARPTRPLKRGDETMFERIIRLAIEHRWLVLLAVLGMAALGI